MGMTNPAGASSSAANATIADKLRSLDDTLTLLAQPEITETERAVAITAIRSAINVDAPILTTVDRSGTIRQAAIAQLAAPARESRRYLMLYNPLTASESLWYNINGPAVINGEATGSIALPAGYGYEWTGNAVPRNALSVIATTLAHAYTAAEG